MSGQSADARAALATIRGAALAAVDPHLAVLAALQRDGNLLRVAGQTIDLRTVARVLVLGAGKAGAPMAQAVEAALGQRVDDGLVIVKDGHGAPTERIRLLEAGHPVPTQAGLDAGADLLALAASATASDLVICLLSGGGSALLEVLPDGVTLADLRATTSMLLASGATIVQVNAIRKHLSRVKGGRLAAACTTNGAPRLITLVLSDVVGSPLDAIASGPTVPDTTTWTDAWAVVQAYDLAARLPETVIAHLQAGLDGGLPDTPRADHPAFGRAVVHVVADNAVAAEAARTAAEALGYTAWIVSTTLEGEASAVAYELVAQTRAVQAAAESLPACLIWGGETTVTLGPTPGHGGRNQELALAAALALQGTSGITLMALATDGSDGPTDGAGAVVDGSTASVSRSLGYDPAVALAEHNAYPLLEATGALLRLGPTRTNVNDLIVVLIEAPQA